MTTKFEFSEPARDRVIRITDVHFDANEKYIVELFDGYTILDQFRTINTRTGTRSAVYILFASIADRIRSSELSGHTIIDRKIKIQPARDGSFALNDDETAFIRPVIRKKSNRKPPSKNNAVAETTELTAVSFADTDFPALDPATDKEMPQKAPAIPKSEPKDIRMPSIATETDLIGAIEDLHMNPNKNAEGQKNEEEEDRPKGHYGKTNYMFAGASEQHKSMADASDVASAQDATFGFYCKASQISAEDHAPPAAPSKPTGSPAGIDMGSNQLKKTEAGQAVKDTSASRISKDDGGFDAKDNGNGNV